ncbi:MAG: hypothetical protein HY906_19565 [Deltaproteobacteria bacterium]|nr:hypothetical protein [Deltaproteobacteria bacterium]
MQGVPPAAFAAIGALAALLLWALLAALGRALRRHRGLARQRHGHAGERRGAALLQDAGWRVLDSHPPAALAVEVDGEPFAQPLEADYLCERDGRTLPAEVKTGQAADLGARATRRQLLEYAVAYRSGATLLVDADAGTVAEVRFPAAGTPAAAHPAGGRGARVAALATALLAGALGGLAAGYWLWAGRP